MSDEKTRKVDLIKEGIVIDHLPANSALKVIEVLHADEGDTVVTVGMNFKSKMIGRKDVVKIENREINEEELNKISLIAPDAKISLIKGYKVVKKLSIKVPNKFVATVRCRNPNCITNHQEIITKFVTEKKDPLKIRCIYCEKAVSMKNIELL